MEFDSKCMKIINRLILKLNELRDGENKVIVIYLNLSHYKYFIEVSNTIIRN